MARTLLSVAWFRYKQSIYADVLATCGQGGSCYVKNDMIKPFDGTVDIVSINFETSKATTLYVSFFLMRVSDEILRCNRVVV